MMRALSLPSAVVLAVSLFAGSAAAQIIGPTSTETAVTGVVRYAFFPTAGSVGGICGQPLYTLEGLEGTVYLASATLDLEPYLDQLVKLHGAMSSECPVLEVASVQAPPPASLAICGTPGFGCTVRLVSGPSGLATHWFLASPFADFIALNPEKGAFLLGQPFALVGPFNSTAFGPARFDFSVPMIPALVDQPIYFQSARRAASLIGPGTQSPIQLANRVTLNVVGFVLLCHEPDC